METKHARMLQFGVGDPTQFGHLPDRNYLRKLKHKERLDPQILNTQYTPREFLGLLLGLIAETGRYSSKLRRDVDNQTQKSEIEKPVQATVKSRLQQSTRDRRSNTDKVYGVNGHRWNKVHGKRRSS